MTHQQSGTEPAWLLKMTMCGLGVKKGDTLSGKPEEVDCSSCLNQLRFVKEPAPE
jgi:hypothetical protein